MTGNGKQYNEKFPSIKSGSIANNTLNQNIIESDDYIPKKHSLRYHGNSRS